MTIVQKASLFAAQAHSGQRRKYTGEPYFAHLTSVAQIAVRAGADEATVAAAYLHDTLEDTSTTYEQLVAEFGREVADLVVELTNVYSSKAYPHLNRRTRKALEAQRLAQISPRAKLVKRADIEDNSATIEARDPDFAQVYLAEKAAELAALDSSPP
jgi:guanosine-3',5'-bis(diphosphate) 3'-pyrophosphohydrolase